MRTEPAPRRAWYLGFGNRLRRRPRHGHGHDTHAAYETSTLRGEGRSFALDVAVPGTIAGIVGGALMAIFYMWISWAFGEGFWALPKMMAGLIWRSSYLPELGAGAAIVGLGLHFAISCTLAVTFAMILPRGGATMFAVLPLALLFSMLVYVVMNFFVVEWASRLMQRELLHPIFFVGHLIWGATLGLIQPLRRLRYGLVNRTTVPLERRREAHA